MCGNDSYSESAESDECPVFEIGRKMVTDGSVCETHIAGGGDDNGFRVLQFLSGEEDEEEEEDEVEIVTRNNERRKIPNPFSSLRKITRNFKEQHASPGGNCVFLSRHGESEFNIHQKIGGDCNLSQRGNMYAKAMGAYFNSMCLKDLEVWTSCLQRTISTARCVKSSRRKQLPQLNEIDSGSLDGLTYDEFSAHYPEEFRMRQMDKLCYKYPGGESYIDCCKRLLPILEVIEKFLHEPSVVSSPSNLLIVTHQGILRCIIGYLCKSDVNAIPYLEIPQHTIIRVSNKSNKRQCVMESVGVPIEHNVQ